MMSYRTYKKNLISPDFRFKPAKMVSGWDGIRDSKDFEPTTCAQMDFHEVSFF